MTQTKNKKANLYATELELSQSQFRVGAWTLSMLIISSMIIAGGLGRMGHEAGERPALMVLASVLAAALVVLLRYQAHNQKHLKAGQEPERSWIWWVSTVLLGAMIGSLAAWLLIQASFIYGQLALLGASS